MITRPDHGGMVHGFPNLLEFGRIFLDVQPDLFPVAKGSRGGVNPVINPPQKLLVAGRAAGFIGVLRGRQKQSVERQSGDALDGR